MVTTAAMVGLAKTAVDSAKSVMKLANEYDKVDLKLKAVELTQQVTELALDNSQLQQTISELQSDIAKLNNRLKIRDELRHDGNVYKRKLTDGKEDGSFCTRCFDVDGILVRVHWSEIYGALCFNCPHCDVLKNTGTEK